MFKVGDKVVRIRGCWPGSPLQLGNIYEVSWVGGSQVQVKGSSLLYSAEDFKLHKPVVEQAEQQSNKRPHYDLIIAWANGAEIEYFDGLRGIWALRETPAFVEHVLYRIKQPTPTKAELALEQVKKAEEALYEAKKSLEKVIKTGG